VVDSTSGQVTYTPYSYLYKHFSHFVEGAHMTASDGSWVDRIVFTNPDGSVVIAMVKRSSSAQKVTLNIDSMRTAPITIPARSVNTFASSRASSR
jgi:glucosylceramidase